MGFHFPPDLRQFLAEGLPVSERFPDWRDDRGRWLRRAMEAPTEGIAFDVRYNDFWMQAWGQRPTQPDEAVAKAMAQVAKAPALVPVFGHRYLPVEPSLEGNPVFSVMQTDIIHYGNDLADYFAIEFSVPRPPWARSSPRQIRFWSDLVEDSSP